MTVVGAEISKRDACESSFEQAAKPLVPMLRMETHARKLRFLLRPQDEHQPHNSGVGSGVSGGPSPSGAWERVEKRGS